MFWENFWGNFDKLILFVLIVFFACLSLKAPFAQKECDILIGSLSTLLVQRLVKGGTPPPPTPSVPVNGAAS